MRQIPARASSIFTSPCTPGEGRVCVLGDASSDPMLSAAVREHNAAAPGAVRTPAKCGVLCTLTRLCRASGGRTMRGTLTWSPSSRIRWDVWMPRLSRSPALGITSPPVRSRPPRGIVGSGVLMTFAASQFNCLHRRQGLVKRASTVLRGVSGFPEPSSGRPGVTPWCVSPCESSTSMRAGTLSCRCVCYP